MQITNTVLMIRPVRFHMNEQTAVNNYFQEKIDYLRKYYLTREKNMID